jgi:hypothetical protein
VQTHHVQAEFLESLPADGVEATTHLSSFRECVDDTIVIVLVGRLRGRLMGLCRRKHDLDVAVLEQMANLRRLNHCEGEQRQRNEPVNPECAAALIVHVTSPCDTNYCRWAAAAARSGLRAGIQTRAAAAAARTVVSACAAVAAVGRADGAAAAAATSCRTFDATRCLSDAACTAAGCSGRAARESGKTVGVSDSASAADIR